MAHTEGCVGRLYVGMSRYVYVCWGGRCTRAGAFRLSKKTAHERHCTEWCAGHFSPSPQIPGQSRCHPGLSFIKFPPKGDDAPFRVYHMGIVLPFWVWPYGVLCPQWNRNNETPWEQRPDKASLAVSLLLQCRGGWLTLPQPWAWEQSSLVVATASGLRGGWRPAHFAVGVGSRGLCLKPVADLAVTTGRTSQKSGVGRRGILIPSIILICVEIKRRWCHSKITFIWSTCKVPLLGSTANLKAETFGPWYVLKTLKIWHGWPHKILESCRSRSHKLPLTSHCCNVGRSKLNSEFHGNYLGLTICIVIDRPLQWHCLLEGTRLGNWCHWWAPGEYTVRVCELGMGGCQLWFHFLSPVLWKVAIELQVNTLYRAPAFLHTLSPKPAEMMVTLGSSYVLLSAYLQSLKVGHKSAYFLLRSINITEAQWYVRRNQFSLDSWKKH